MDLNMWLPNNSISCKLLSCHPSWNHQFFPKSSKIFCKYCLNWPLVLKMFCLKIASYRVERKRLMLELVVICQYASPWYLLFHTDLNEAHRFNFARVWTLYINLKVAPWFVKMFPLRFKSSYLQYYPSSVGLDARG